MRPILAVLLFVAGCAAAAPAPSPAKDATRQQITILYDAFGKPSQMEKDWGFAALIEYGGKRILFDTGDNPDILAKNAKAKGVDLSNLDFAVLSHRHGDHMGGLDYLLSVNPRVKIYAPKENFGVYGFSLPGSFYRKDEALPPEQRYYDGAPPQILKFGSAWPKANFELIEKTTEIAPGIRLIATVSDKPTTLELRELSLAIDTPDGIVTALRDKYKVAYIAPGHCTGEPAFAALEKAFARRYLYAGLGTGLAIGPTPGPVDTLRH